MSSRLSLLFIIIIIIIIAMINSITFLTCIIDHIVCSLSIYLAVVQRNTAKRRREMLEAELILKEELGKFRLWQQSLGAIPTIAKLQEKAETLRQEEMTKAAKVIMMMNDDGCIDDDDE